jgi:transcription initiation factor TFIIIB Brf1 subunit/transcription initiation factor TFIIB
MKCTCGSTQIENDSSKGENFCRQCGKVLEESNMVAEVS